MCPVDLSSLLLTPSASSGSHESKLVSAPQTKTAKAPKTPRKRVARKVENEDQNVFGFMEKENQRGIFDESSRNMYEGEDLDVPAYLRKGVKIAI